MAVILDACSGRVIGYTISRSIDARLTIAARTQPSRTGGPALGVSITATVGRSTPALIIARFSLTMASLDS